MDGDVCPPTPTTLKGCESPGSASPSEETADDDKSKIITELTGRSSPDSNCAICLGRMKNKSFTDNCLHQFCFDCLLEWSKVKAECPLCKQQFKSIIHNVRSIDDYDQYHLNNFPPRSFNPETFLLRSEPALAIPRNFRYRTTLTGNRRPFTIGLEAPSHSRHYVSSHNYMHHLRRTNAIEFRRRIYQDDMWARPMHDITGRYRDTSPMFYSTNPAQVHRLGPWLDRELTALIDNQERRNLLWERILDLITYYSIRSPELRSRILPHLGGHTDHFIHEFYTFARSPYDMYGYDQAVSYVNPLELFSNLPNNSPHSSSEDSDVLILSPPSPAESYHVISENRNNSFNVPTTSTGLTSSPYFGNPPGPSTSRANITEILAPSDDSSHQEIVANDTVHEVQNANSDSEDCLFVGYVKPRHERTPEIITLSSDDNDIDIIEHTYPSTNDFHDLNEDSSAVSIFSLSDVSTAPTPSSSDSEYLPYAESKHKKKHSKRKTVIDNTKRTKVKPCQEKMVTKRKSKKDSARKRSETRKKKSYKRRSSSSSSDSSSSSSHKKFRWQIKKHDRDGYDTRHNYDEHAPYTRSEIAAFNEVSRPKLKSIVITRTAPSSSFSSEQPSSSTHNCNYSPGSSKHSSRHKHKSEKRRKKKSRKERSRSSSLEFKFSNSKRKKRKLSSDSSS